MPINLVALVLASFFCNFILLLIFKRFTLRRKIFLSQGIPHIGGIAAGISFLSVSLAVLCLLSGLDRQSTGIILSGCAMLVFGILDDLLEFSVKAKFAAQTLAILLLIFLGVRTQIIYIGPFLNAAIMIIWMLGITNAFNHLDIMDGLAAGASLIASFSLLVIALMNAHVPVIVFLAVLTGACLSFLFFNFPPAKVYMGNSGSHLLGFILASVVPLLSYAPMDRKIALMSPILILGLPIFDTGFLVLMRVMKKKSIFRKSNDHLALRLLSIGYSKNKVLFFMLGLGSIYALSGILITRIPNTAGVCVVAVLGLITVLITKKISRIAIDG